MSEKNYDKIICIIVNFNIIKFNNNKKIIEFLFFLS